MLVECVNQAMCVTMKPAGHAPVWPPGCVGLEYGGSWRGHGQHVDMWNIFLMLACARGRDVFPHQTACKCVNPRNEDNGGPRVDPAGAAGWLSQVYSSPVGAREHLAGAGHVGRPGACGCCGVCVMPGTVLGAADRAVNKTQAQSLGAYVLVEEFRS